MIDSPSTCGSKGPLIGEASYAHRFAAIDMQTTTFLLHAVKRIFPTFEFTWLGEEMEQNLPLEMDFRACFRRFLTKLSFHCWLYYQQLGLMVT